MNPQQAAAYNAWQRKRHAQASRPPEQPPPIPGDPYLLIGGPMAGATVFLANPGTLPIRWGGQTGQYAGAHGSNSLEWTAGAGD